MALWRTTEPATSVLLFLWKLPRSRVGGSKSQSDIGNGTRPRFVKLRSDLIAGGTCRSRECPPYAPHNSFLFFDIFWRTLKLTLHLLRCGTDMQLCTTSNVPYKCTLLCFAFHSASRGAPP